MVSGTSVRDGFIAKINEEKKGFSQDSNLSKLDDVVKDCDMFLGLSGPGVLTSEMVLKMKTKMVLRNHFHFHPEAKVLRKLPPKAHFYPPKAQL